MPESEPSTIDYSGATELDPSDPTLGEKFILFEVAGRVCAVPARSVLEVTNSLAVTVIPNSPAWLIGLSVFRGDPVAMIQPHSVISGAPKRETIANFKSIIFRSRDGEVQPALPVDRIKEMFTVPETAETRSIGIGTDGLLRNGATVEFVDIYSFVDGFRKEDADGCG